MMTTDLGESLRYEGAEQFRELMAHLQQVFWIKNADDDAVLYVSPAYEAISGRTCQSLRDDFRTFLDAVHPEDRERLAAAMAHQVETGGYDEEYRIVRSDGTIRWIRARSYPVRDGHGRVLRFAGIADDITGRKELEQDRARLAAIVEYSEDAIVSMSVDCVIISWNRGAERQYGYTAEEIIGRSLSVLFPPDHYQEYLRILKKVRQGEPVEACDTVRRRKDGTLVNASVNIFPIEARNHEVVGASKISRDVTAIKRLEAQAIAAQKMEVVGQLATGMVHDLNNQLSVIVGLSDLMVAGSGASDPLRADAEAIRAAAERAAMLTSQLLVFSRKQVAPLVVLEINDVVKNLDKMLRQFVGDAIVLTVILGERVGRVKANAGYLGQVLVNLVVNARDAMPAGGTVTVSTSYVLTGDAGSRSVAGAPPGNWVLLSVRDTGTGMTDDVKARLFQPFFTTKPEGKGTGLGLATCETIVKLSGGHIRVRSEPSHGSTFDVYLPVAGEHPDVHDTPSLPGSQQGDSSATTPLSA